MSEARKINKKYDLPNFVFFIKKIKVKLYFWSPDLSLVLDLILH